MRVVALMAACLACVGLSLANDVHASVKSPTNIPPQGLGPALKSLAVDRGFQIVYISKDIDSQKTGGAVGDFTSDEALRQLLKGTNLTFHYLNEKTVSVEPIAVRATSSSEISQLPSAPPATAPTSASPAPPQAAPATEQGPSGRPAKNEESETALEEVTVYAQKRGVGESSQKVPLAITAISANTLDEMHSVDVRDVGKLAPNVQTADVGTTPGFPNFTIRGIGVNSSLRSVDPSVNIVVDGMTVGYQAGAIPSTFDLESVEVLRGPQGVLFGRNSTGGAIVLRTRRPSDTFGVQGDITFGNFHEIDVNASIEGKLGSDRVLGKVAVMSRTNDGYIENTNDGIFTPAVGNPSGAPVTHAVGNIGQTHELIVKPTFTFLVTDDVTLNVFSEYEHYSDGGATPFNFPTPPGSLDVALHSQYGFTPTAGDYETNSAFPGYVHLEAYHAIGELDWKLGAGSLTTILAYRHINFNPSI